MRASNEVISRFLIKVRSLPEEIRMHWNLKGAMGWRKGSKNSNMCNFSLPKRESETSLPNFVLPPRRSKNAQIRLVLSFPQFIPIFNPIFDM